MIVEWNDRALASVEQQRETYHSARGYTRTKLTPRSGEWSIQLQYGGKSPLKEKSKVFKYAKWPSKWPTSKSQFWDLMK